MIRTIVLSSTLALFLGALGGCLVQDRRPPDRTVTCNDFATFVHNCTTRCSVTWSCERYYDSLDIDTQISLDECSDCLTANLAGGVCADCRSDYVGSCRAFMEDLLRVDCW